MLQGNPYKLAVFALHIVIGATPFPQMGPALNSRRNSGGSTWRLKHPVTASENCRHVTQTHSRFKPLAQIENFIINVQAFLVFCILWQLQVKLQ